MCFGARRRHNNDEENYSSLAKCSWFLFDTQPLWNTIDTPTMERIIEKLWKKTATAEMPEHKWHPHTHTPSKDRQNNLEQYV